MPHRAATVALAPLLLWQGRRVRRVVPRLPEPEGARRGVLGHGPPLSVIIIGDSAAAGVGADIQNRALTGQVTSRLAERFTVTYRLLAKTGWTTRECARAVATDDDAQRYDIALTSLGVNDATALSSPAKFRRAQCAFIDALTERFGIRHTVITALPPVHQFPALPWPLRPVIGGYARALNTSLAAIAQTRSACSLLDLLTEAEMTADVMASDGFHPGPPVYAEWGRRAADGIAQLYDDGALGTPPAGA